MIEIFGLPASYQAQLEGMTMMEVAVAAATYRSSSCNRKGKTTDGILRWHKRNRPEEHKEFLLLYGSACHVVKIQRQLDLCERPANRPVAGSRRVSRRQSSSHSLAFA